MSNRKNSPPRKRSRQVTLVGLAGGAVAVGLGGCTTASWHRNVYSSVEDCAGDYSLADCKRLGRLAGPARYLGPAYRLRGERASSCHGDDKGPGLTWSSQWNRPKMELIGRGDSATSCRRSSTGSSNWGSSASGGSSATRRGVFGSRSGFFGGG